MQCLNEHIMTNEQRSLHREIVKWNLVRIFVVEVVKPPMSNIATLQEKEKTA